MLRDVYTGRYPKSGMFGGRKDVAVVSGVKNFEVFNASARALNFIMQDVKAKARASGPTAFAEGTPLIAYSPAVLTDEQILTVEFAVDSFPAEFIKKVGGALSGLAGIPLLLPYAGILLGAGEVVKLAAGLGDALFDGRPSFSVTHALPFDVPGSPIVKAAFRILCADTFDASQYSYRDGAGLVDANGRRYEGDEPYVVISLDGREHSELASFTPTVASAAVLQRFFHMRDGGTAAIDTLMEGLKLVSDMRYRQKAEALQKKIVDTPAGPAKDKLQAELDAILKNIGNDLLKPKA
jgi:hypothetical protein